MMNPAVLPPTSRAVHAETLPPSRKKILLVDDAELFLELQKSIFSREDVELLFAGNGREALEIVRTECPDLIFLDLLMPEMDGDLCCRMIKSHPEWKGIPVVIVTGIRGQEALERCRRAGCEEIIFKPIDRAVVLKVAGKLLQLHTRQTDRVPARLSIRYGTEGEENLADYSVNLSTGGVFIETENILPEDTALEVEFTLPECQAVIRCPARVAWTNPPQRRKSAHLPPGMGLQFLGLRMQELDLIREYVQARNIVGG